MILEYTAWGDTERYYVQAAFSILTMLPDPAVEAICVVTDHPERFRFLRDKIDIIHITQETVTDWKGPWNYTFRMKIKGAQRVVEQYPGKDVLHVDTDTFRGRPLEPVRKHLASGNVCMNDDPGLICKMIARNNRETWAALKGKTFSGYTVDETSRHMNSGTVGLPGKDAAGIMRNVVAIVDELFGQTGDYWSEELSFNFGLALHGPALDIGNIVGHYWSNKLPWDTMAHEFFANHLVKGSTPEEMSAAACAVDFTKIPIYTHTPRRHRQLMRIANKYWPLTRTRYFPEKIKQYL